MFCKRLFRALSNITYQLGRIADALDYLVEDAPPVSSFTVSIYGGQPMSVANIAMGSHGATAAIDPASVVDAAGAADSFLSPPVWSSDNPAVASVTGAADGMSADIQAVSIGTCNALATYTNPDGTTAVSSTQINVTAAPVDDVAAFSVNVTPNP